MAGNPAYNYKYQGQELQETGWYSFKWRNYMPDIGRFFNIDPLAETYPTWGPYVFSGNRVIDARELEGLEPYVLFNTRENAAINFGQQYNGKSIKQYREYAAIIYSVKKSDGKTYYAYNKPVKGGNAGATPNHKLPNGTRAGGIIHSHGGYEVNYDNNNFSGSTGDKGYAEYYDLDIFVSTPNGSLKYYDVSSNTERTVTTKLPSDPTRQNKTPPVENPNPATGDYKPKPIKIFPDSDTSTDKSKSKLDGGLKSIEDKKREQTPLINRSGTQKINYETIFFIILTTLLSCCKNGKLNQKEDQSSDSNIAISLAGEKWIEIYGKSVNEQKPFVAEKKNDSLWIVQGTLPKNRLGGVAYAEINIKTKKVIKYTHGK